MEIGGSAMRRPLTRRAFCKYMGGTFAGACLGGGPMFSAQSSPAGSDADAEILQRIAAHRPSRLGRLPIHFREQVGATHVAGKYHLTNEPFLLEGASKLLELGSRLGKFWFIPDTIQGSYPFNSQWGKYKHFVDLARADYFQQLFEMPFATLILEAHTPFENNWRREGLPESFYQTVTQEFYELTAHLYKVYRDRPATIILQHWEGDWLLRGRGGELWDPPPNDWRERCERMQRWLSARQAGVTKARSEHGHNAACRVAHAAEVNRVADAWKGIPTMTREVLPAVELDLVSYSCYDGMKDPLTLWKCLEEIRQKARTGPLFGPGAVFAGEIGIPENEQPHRLAERWDEWMGVLLAAQVHYIVHWELYCNEFSKDAPKPHRAPVTDPGHVRGFWLVKPDGTLSASGSYFRELWERAGKPA